MQPLNDDNLDRLSQEAADQFEMDTGAFGWERLEKRLTQELPEEEKDRRRFLFWLFFIVFVTGGGLLMMLGTGRQSSRYKVQGTSQQPVGSEQLVVSENKAQDTRNKSQDTRQHEDGSKKNEVRSTDPPAEANPQQPANSAQLPTTENKAQGTRDKAQEKTKYEVGSTKLVKRSAPVSIDGKTKKPIQKPASDDKGSLTHNQAPATNDKQPETNTQQPETSNQQPTTEPARKTLTVDPAPVTSTNEPAPGTKQPAASNQQPETSNKKPATDTRKPSGLELGLVFGPDWTYVNYWQSYKTGYNVGLQIGYRLNNRWSANTGLFYTKKNYAANGKDFTAPKRSYISYQDLRYLKGDCSMFEIPVNLRYDVVANKKNRIFASAGLTSYIMNKQGYDYAYYDRFNSFHTRYWDTTGSYKHFFSVVNISAGYEWSLNKKFSLQAEPYLKLPLKGLGYGTMRMQSMGINLSVKYRPVFKTSRKDARENGAQRH